MFVIPNSTNNKPSTTITMFVDINIILPVVYLFLAKRDIRFKVL